MYIKKSMYRNILNCSYGILSRLEVEFFLYGKIDVCHFHPYGKRNSNDYIGHVKYYCNFIYVNFKSFVIHRSDCTIY